MKTLSMLAAMFAFLVVWSGPAQAQQAPKEELNALRSEIEALKEDQARIRRELKEIKAIVQGRASARQNPSGPVRVSVDGDPYKGSPTAPITIVEFSDYQCPYCARHVRETLPELEQQYIETGKVKYVFRDFPLSSIHAHAFKAAEAASCAGEQGRYWEMHDHLFTNRKALSQENLAHHAQTVGLNAGLFTECLNSGRTAPEIRKDLMAGQKAGVRGTPTFFIGRTVPGSSSITALVMLRGAKPYEQFQQTVEAILKGQEHEQRLAPPEPRP